MFWNSRETVLVQHEPVLDGRTGYLKRFLRSFFLGLGLGGTPS